MCALNGPFRLTALNDPFRRFVARTVRNVKGGLHDFQEVCRQATAAHTAPSCCAVVGFISSHRRARPPIPAFPGDLSAPMVARPPRTMSLTIIAPRLVLYH